MTTIGITAFLFTVLNLGMSIPLYSKLSFSGSRISILLICCFCSGITANCFWIWYLGSSRLQLPEEMFYLVAAGRVIDLITDISIIVPVIWAYLRKKS